MASQKSTFEQRQERLEARMRALLDRQRHLKERQRAKEKEQMRALFLELGRTCVSEGINTPEALAAFFMQVKAKKAPPPVSGAESFNKQLPD